MFEDSATIFRLILERATGFCERMENTTPFGCSSSWCFGWACVFSWESSTSSKMATIGWCWWRFDERGCNNRGWRNRLYLELVCYASSSVRNRRNVNARSTWITRSWSIPTFRTNDNSRRTERLNKCPIMSEGCIYICTTSDIRFQKATGSNKVLAMIQNSKPHSTLFLPNEEFS